jgi:hypothetical protein
MTNLVAIVWFALATNAPAVSEQYTQSLTFTNGGLVVTQDMQITVKHAEIFINELYAVELDKRWLTNEASHADLGYIETRETNKYAPPTQWLAGFPADSCFFTNTFTN